MNSTTLLHRYKRVKKEQNLNYNIIAQYQHVIQKQLLYSNLILSKSVLQVQNMVPQTTKEWTVNAFPHLSEKAIKYHLQSE